MDKYIKLYKNRISKLIKELGLSREDFEKKYDVSQSAVSVWFSGRRYPPFHVILDIARESNTNISYVLGLTDIRTPLTDFEPCMDLKKTLGECNETISSVARKLNSSTNVVKNNFNRDMPARINTMIALSKALEVSVDYLLGLTKYKTWEDEMMARDPFIYIQPGTPALVASPETDDKCYALLSDDGKTVYFSDGKNTERDKMQGYIVKPCKEETL